jgi:hypothetical protein
METITIVRRGEKALERTVEIYYGRLRQKIDPQQEILFATGVLFDRNYCVQSMAWGFQNAGAHVIMDNRKKTHRWIYDFRTPDVGVPIYHLYGLAFARREWGQLLSSLHTHVLPASRFQVLETTASYYWGKRFLIDPIRLQLP